MSSSGRSGVIQRGFPQGIASSHLIYLQSQPRSGSQCLDKGLHFVLCIDFEKCVLDVSHGAVCTCLGVQRKKVRRRNLNFLRWGPIHVAQSHWHTSYVQKLERKPAIVRATTFSENFIEPEPDEETVGSCPATSMTSILIQQLSENS